MDSTLKDAHPEQDPGVLTAFPTEKPDGASELLQERKRKADLAMALVGLK